MHVLCNLLAMFELKLVENNLVLGVESGVTVTAVAVNKSAEYVQITMQGGINFTTIFIMNIELVCRSAHAQFWVKLCMFRQSMTFLNLAVHPQLFV